MRRREFVMLVGGAAVVWPIAVRAQQPAMPVIGFLNSTSPTAWAHLVAAFRQGLSEMGYVEHRSVGIEWRWAEGRYEQLPALAADLVRRQVAVIVSTGGLNSIFAAKAATTDIPIVFTTGTDPVKDGLVASLNRPDGNITGVHMFVSQMEGKRFGTIARVGSDGRVDRCAPEPHPSPCREAVEGCPGSRARHWSTDSNRARKQRARPCHGVHDAGPTARRSVARRRGPILQQPAVAVGQTVGTRTSFLTSARANMM